MTSRGDVDAPYGTRGRTSTPIWRMRVDLRPPTHTGRLTRVARRLRDPRGASAGRKLRSFRERTAVRDISPRCATRQNVERSETSGDSHTGNGFSRRSANRARKNIMTPRAPARARLPLLRFRPGGVGLDDTTRGAGVKYTGMILEVVHIAPRTTGQENSPSGLWRQLGKLVGCKPSGVRIPHSPPSSPPPR